MSGYVISFGKKQRWASGMAVCMSCKHEEVSVAPIGAIDLECSACGSMKSRWKYEFRPDVPVSTCKCGNQLFYMTSKGHLCPNCGTYQSY